MRPRIRTVKPELWHDPGLARSCRDARLLFIGILNYVDDEGRIVYSPKMLAGAIFPHDDDVNERKVMLWLAQLEDVSGVIARYEVDGVRYLWVRKFREHQVINRPSPSKLPPHPADPGFTDDSVNDPGLLSDGSPPERKGTRERKSRVRATDEPFAAEFDAVWSDYPRKLNRAGAFTKYQATRRKGATADDLHRAVKHYAAAVSDREDRFILHGRTFFGPDEHWRDYLEPAASSAAGVNEYRR